MMTCKKISKCDFYFDESIKIEKILRSQWFDRFRNIKNVYYLNVLPKFVNKIEFSDDFRKPIKKLPLSITHMTLNDWNINFIRDPFPKGITHLIINNMDERTIYYFPPLVTHLTVGNIIHYHNIDDELTLTHLILNKNFNRNIKNKIPKGIKYLTLHEKFKKFKEKCIPSTVKEVTIIGAPSKKRIKYIKQFIPKKCKLLVRLHY